MAKASFSAGYAKMKLALGRSPMVARLHTGDTIVEFETSFPKDRAWLIYQFLQKMADEKTSPVDAFNETFGSE